MTRMILDAPGGEILVDHKQESAGHPDALLPVDDDVLLDVEDLGPAPSPVYAPATPLRPAPPPQSRPSVSVSQRDVAAAVVGALFLGLTVVITRLFAQAAP